MSANCCCILNPLLALSPLCLSLIELHVFFVYYISSKSMVIFMVFELAIVVLLAADIGRMLLFIVFVLLSSCITGGERAKIGASRSPGDLDRAEEGSGHHGEYFHPGKCDHLGQQTT